MQDYGAESSSTAVGKERRWGDMTPRAFDQPDDRSSTLRRLRILVIALLCSNIGLGLFGFYVLREIDRKYSRLIAETVPSLNELQTITATSIEAMRGTNPIAYD